MTFVLILWMKKIIGERSFPSLGERMLPIKLLGIYIMKIFAPIQFFSYLVSYDMGIRYKKTILITITMKKALYK